MSHVAIRRDSSVIHIEFTDDELDKLAMNAPLVKRMIIKLAELDNFYPNDDELEQLLDEIGAAMEKKS